MAAFVVAAVASMAAVGAKMDVTPLQSVSVTLLPEFSTEMSRLDPSNY